MPRRAAGSAAATASVAGAARTRASRALDEGSSVGASASAGGTGAGAPSRRVDGEASRVGLARVVNSYASSALATSFIVAKRASAERESVRATMRATAGPTSGTSESSAAGTGPVALPG